MGEHLGILVDLHVLGRPIAFMRAHNRREDRHFRPAHRKLGRTDIAKKARIAADIGVVVGISEQAGRQVLPQMKTCSLPHAHGRVPAETPSTPLGNGKHH
jgi:hypothetical protein